MNSNFSLKFKISDLICIILCLTLSICLLVGILINSKTSKLESRYVEIYVENVLQNDLKVDLSSLKEDKVLILKKEDYDCLLGDFIIEISPKKGVRASEVTCPNHTCTRQGWVNINNLSIVCIPNKVRIEIVPFKNGGDFVIQEVFYEKTYL